MDAKLRHAGLVVQNLEAAINWYKFFGFRAWKRSFERWNGQDLKVCKMTDHDEDVLELIEGNWKPHVAITVAGDGALEELWIKHGDHYGVIMERKNRVDKTIVYLKDPWGNYVEIVHERGENEQQR